MSFSIFIVACIELFCIYFILFLIAHILLVRKTKPSFSCWYLFNINKTKKFRSFIKGAVTYHRIALTDAERTEIIEKKNVYPVEKVVSVALKVFAEHTVYPVTPNAGMFYQRGYKQ